MAETAKVAQLGDGGDDVFEDASEHLVEEREIERVAQQLAATLPLEEGESLRYSPKPQGNKNCCSNR